MLRIDGLSKGYAKQELFSHVSFAMNPGERLGLVGKNGHGKTTLFKLILGEEEPDKGTVVIPKGYSVGHLSQHLVFKKPTVLEEASASLPMTDDGFQEIYKAEAMLSGLGFAIKDFDIPPSELSGGFQIRLNLVKLLLMDPNLLLLDEPTNYLDIVSVRWLTRFLRAWKSEMILITHDRAFMDSVTTHTMAIHRAKVKKVEGGTEKLYQQLFEEEEIYEKTRLNEEKKRKDIEAFINRFRAQATRARAVQSRVKALERQGVRDKLQDIATLEFQFNSVDFPGKWVLEAKRVGFGYTEDDPLFTDVSFAVGKSDRIGIIGKNGRGKTTLLNILAGEFAPKSGEVTVNGNTRMAYFGQTNVSRLDPKKTVEEEVLQTHPDRNRTVARSICGAMMFEGDTALKRVSVLSGGEKSRVLLGKLIVTPANCLLLDEPTNHLDMDSIEALVDAIDAFPGAVIIVTHDELLLNALVDRLVIFDGEGATVFEGGYQDFLERIGWEDERDEASQSRRNNNSEKGSSLNKKEARRQRAEKVKLLAPLRKKVSDIEAEIISLEKEVKEKSLTLAELSDGNAHQQIADLMTDVHRASGKINTLFQKLEDANRVLESREKELEADAL